jgi:hypothetical protein
MAVKTGVWGRRGWNFQEGLMSTRCIVFGPEQVYYECAEDTFCESITEPCPDSPRPGPRGSSKSVLRDPFLDQRSDSIALYWSLVQNYTSRNLTHATDSLLAFQGFFEYFSALRNMSFLWGLPNNPDLPRNLLWEHGPWNDPSVTRRPGFPSWSWAGWAGAVYMNFPADNDPQTTFTLTQVLDKEKTEAKQEDLVLRFTAYLATVTLSVHMLVCATGDEKSSFMLDCGLYETTSFHGMRYEYMEICRGQGSTHGLLLRRRKDEKDVFERIGSGFMQLMTLDAVNPARKNVKLG